MAIRRNGPRTYSEILDVAARVFDERGYHETTVQDIADAINLTKGGLYHHLSGKEETLYAINERYLRAGLKEVEEIASSTSSDVELRLRNLIVAIAGQHDTYEADLRVALLEFDSVSPEHRGELIKLRDRYESTVEAVIREGMEAGVFDGGADPDLLTKFLFGALNWMCLWYRPGGAYTARQIGETYADLILSSFKAAPGNDY